MGAAFSQIPQFHHRLTFSSVIAVENLGKTVEKRLFLGEIVGNKWGKVLSKNKNYKFLLLIDGLGKL
ncbi:MAG: hypothetical protein SAJ12_05350, partial [Jaaginema sp. PMC 1079.18]|nr:hypothetical protein [Jaaginema sp. PMC 1079.18]